MGGKVLALIEERGYRPLLVVRNVSHIPQQDARQPSTAFYGLQLMFPSDDRPGWVAFMRLLLNKPALYAQLALPSNDTEQQVMDLYPRLPWIEVGAEELTLLKGGHDPVAGYYVQFAGTARLFSQAQWWVENEEFYDGNSTNRFVGL